MTKTWGTSSPVLFSINVRNTFALIFIPLMAICFGHSVPVQKGTLQFGLFYSLLRALAVTTGYHRLWAHKTYTASTALKLTFALLGAGAGQDHIKKWARDHRAHHRYVDTEQDPYNAKKGFFHAHIGWIIFENPKASKTGRVDISDLNSDWIVQWQKAYYVLLFLTMAYAVPSIICGFHHGDFLGGFVWAGCIGTALDQQLTFCVNSVAHLFGDQPFTDLKSARQVPVIIALFLGGEGYHNYHHEFPTDYRLGTKWYDMDLGKWTISLLSLIGLASKLKTVPENEINKSILQRKLQMLEREGEKVDWGIPLDELPIWKWEDYREKTRTGHNLIVIRGAVHDVSEFTHEHPGGHALIASAIGTDATKQFEGEVYRHSNAASNLLDKLRIALIQKG